MKEHLTMDTQLQLLRLQYYSHTQGSTLLAMGPRLAPTEQRPDRNGGGKHGVGLSRIPLWEPSLLP